MKKNKGEVRLYNLIFPVWILVALPIFWIPVFLLNFGIDSALLCIVMKKLGLENRKEIYKRSIAKIFLFGITSDIIGGVFMIIFSCIFDELLGWHKASLALMYNPWSNFIGFICTILCMAVSSFMIYIFDSKIAMKKTDLNEQMKKKIAMIFAIFTMPILFLLPTGWFMSY